MGWDGEVCKRAHMNPCALGDEVARQVEVLHGFTDGDVAGREQPQRLLEARLQLPKGKCE